MHPAYHSSGMNIVPALYAFGRLHRILLSGIYASGIQALMLFINPACKLLDRYAKYRHLFARQVIYRTGMIEDRQNKGQACTLSPAWIYGAL